MTWKLSTGKLRIRRTSMDPLETRQLPLDLGEDPVEAIYDCPERKRWSLVTTRRQAEAARARTTSEDGDEEKSPTLRRKDERKTAEREQNEDSDGLDHKHNDEPSDETPFFECEHDDVALNR